MKAVLAFVLLFVISPFCFAECAKQELSKNQPNKWSVKSDGFSIQPLKFRFNQKLHTSMLKYLLGFKEDGIMHFQPLTLAAGYSALAEEIRRDFFLQFEKEQPQAAAYLKSMQGSVAKQAQGLIATGYVVGKVQLRWTGANKEGLRLPPHPDGVFYRIIVVLEGSGTVVNYPTNDSKIPTSPGELLIMSGTRLENGKPTLHESPEVDSKFRLYMVIDMIPG